MVRLGRKASGRFVMGADVRLWEQHDWSPGVSGKAGLEFTPGDTVRPAGRSWSILIEGYTGPSPYGQFFSEDIAYVGFGLYFNL